MNNKQTHAHVLTWSFYKCVRLCAENIKASLGDHGQNIPVPHVHTDERSHADFQQGRDKPEGEAEGWRPGILNRPLGAE